MTAPLQNLAGLSRALSPAVYLSRRDETFLLSMVGMRVTDLSAADAERLTLLSSPNDGHWVTIDGTHVQIRDGKIVKGPAALVGRTHGDAKGQLSHRGTATESFHKNITEDGTYATDAGHQISVKGGKITHGPAELVGKDASEYSKAHGTKVKKLAGNTPEEAAKIDADAKAWHQTKEAVRQRATRTAPPNPAFKTRDNYNPDTHAIVHVDPQKLAEHTAKTDPGFHVGTGGAGASADPGKYANAAAHVESASNGGTPITTPVVAVHEGKASVEDGRHHVAALADSGVKSVPVEVAKGNASHVAEKFGAKPEARAPKQPHEMTRDELSKNFESVRNNQLTPWSGTVPPEGTHRMDPVTGQLSKLKHIDPKSVQLTEFGDDIKGREDYQKYVQWAKEGKAPPPITAGEHADGGYMVTDNRRRTMAAMEAGNKTIPAWVDVQRKPGYPLTHKEAVASALAQGKHVPSEVLKDYPDLATKTVTPPPAKESTTAAPGTLADKSKGHVGFIADENGQHELYKTASGNLNRAPVATPVDGTTGRRTGEYVAAKGGEADAKAAELMTGKPKEAAKATTPAVAPTAPAAPAFKRSFLTAKEQVELLRKQTAHIQKVTADIKAMPALDAGKSETPAYSIGEYKGERHTYGVKNGPLNAANAPADSIVGSQGTHPDYPHGTIDYSRKLSDKEASAAGLEHVQSQAGKTKLLTDRSPAPATAQQELDAAKATHAAIVSKMQGSHSAAKALSGKADKALADVKAAQAKVSTAGGDKPAFGTNATADASDVERMRQGFAKMTTPKLKQALQDHEKFNGGSTNKASMARGQVLRDELTKRGVKIVGDTAAPVALPKSATAAPAAPAAKASHAELTSRIDRLRKSDPGMSYREAFTHATEGTTPAGVKAKIAATVAQPGEHHDPAKVAAAHRELSNTPGFQVPQKLNAMTPAMAGAVLAHEEAKNGPPTTPNQRIFTDPLTMRAAGKVVPAVPGADKMRNPAEEVSPVYHSTRQSSRPISRSFR